jgi:hypothetical protein
METSILLLFLAFAAGAFFSDYQTRDFVQLIEAAYDIVSPE